MAIMGRVAAQVAAVFIAQAVVQIPIFKALRVIKVVIISNLAREVNRSSKADIRVIQNS